MKQRIPLASVEDATRIAREAGLPESYGALSAIRVLANHPVLARGVLAQHAALRFANSLPVRLRELMIMRIAWRHGAEYEWAQHWRVATQAGVPHEDILGVRDWRTYRAYSAADRAALAATDDTLERGGISDAVWEECVAHIGGTEQLIEMVIAIGHWNAFAFLLRSLAVPLEDGTPNWPPDGRRPAGAI